MIKWGDIGHQWAMGPRIYNTRPKDIQFNKYTIFNVIPFINLLYKNVDLTAPFYSCLSFLIISWYWVKRINFRRKNEWVVTRSEVKVGYSLRIFSCLSLSMRILVALVLGLSLAAHRSSSVIVLLILHVGAYMYLQYLANRMLQLLSGLWLFRTITRLAIIIIQ